MADLCEQYLSTAWCGCGRKCETRDPNLRHKYVPAQEKDGMVVVTVGYVDSEGYSRETAVLMDAQEKGWVALAEWVNEHVPEAYQALLKEAEQRAECSCAKVYVGLKEAGTREWRAGCALHPTAPRRAE